MLILIFWWIFCEKPKIYSIIQVLVNISCEIWRILARADPHRAHDCPFEFWHISYKIQILQQPAKLSLTYPLLKTQSQHMVSLRQEQNPIMKFAIPVLKMFALCMLWKTQFLSNFYSVLCVHQILSFWPL